MLFVLATVATAELIEAKPLYPVLYLDLDKTALTDEDSILPATTSAVKAFRRCGGHVGLASGRTLEQAQYALRVLEPDLPVVLYNGAVRFFPQSHEVVVRAHLDSITVVHVAQVAKHIRGLQGLVLHYSRRAVTPQLSARLRKFSQRKLLGLMQATTLFPAAAYERDPVIKIVLICRKPDRARVAHALKAGLPNSARVVVSSDETVEVIPAQVNKAEAIQEGLQPLGFSLADVVAFGDSQNDVEMLRDVGLGLAMCDSDPEARAAAALLVGSNNTDTIARFLHRMIIQEPCGPADTRR